MKMKPASPILMLTLGQAMRKAGQLNRNQHQQKLGQELVNQAKVERSKQHLDRLLKKVNAPR